MSATAENLTLPNPLRSTYIPLVLLTDNAEERIRDSTTFEPFAFITTKQHATLPLSIHNYNHRSFWSSSPLSSFSTTIQQQVVDSQAVLSDENEASLALTLASRSLITEGSTGRVVSRSFVKFFNHDEKLSYQPTGNEHAYEIQEKVDGSIISLFWYEPQIPSGSSQLQSRGQWIVASRSSFASPHTESARNILNTRFPSLVSDTQESSLDRTKTYVFELVDSRMPIKIHYQYHSDLVLLAIIGNDGSETRLNDTGLPFRRPRIWKLDELIPGENGTAVTAPNLKQLNKLHRANEEGFVITFWRTQDDVYPQRVKVKLEDYLKLCHRPGPANREGGKTVDYSSRKSLRHLSNSSTKPLMSLNGPPSPHALVNIYTAYRVSIPSFFKIDACMSSVCQRLIEAIRCLNVSDDYGGEAWLTKITKTWDRIHALFSIHEIDWKEWVRKLEQEGYKSRPLGKNATTMKDFDMRIGRMDRSLIPSLKAWFEGQNVKEIVRLVVESVEVPNDLKSTEVIVLHSM